MLMGCTLLAPFGSCRAVALHGHSHNNNEHQRAAILATERRWLHDFCGVSLGTGSGYYQIEHGCCQGHYTLVSWCPVRCISTGCCSNDSTKRIAQDDHALPQPWRRLSCVLCIQSISQQRIENPLWRLSGRFGEALRTNRSALER